MKVWLGDILPAVAVALAFGGAAQVEPLAWRLLALVGSFLLLQAFFVQKYPRWISLRWAMQLKPGEKVEVEGK